MKKSLLVAVCLLGTTCAGLTRAAEFVLQPVSASGTFTITGNEIKLTGGNQRVNLEVKLKGFAPHAMKTYQATLNCAGYSSGGNRAG